LGREGREEGRTWEVFEVLASELVAHLGDTAVLEVIVNLVNVPLVSSSLLSRSLILLPMVRAQLSAVVPSAWDTPPIQARREEEMVDVRVGVGSGTTETTLWRYEVVSTCYTVVGQAAHHG
jgi:hypothetical protein